ncbi:myb-like protein U isoform X2 [Cydia splendana]|uniref:myb-like protein U isoform X2 n=1 Tax=Cydia splendana TaxID=1100963 RepID=UPI00300CB417
MSTNADADDEYLDDPITLLNIEDIKTEILDEDQIINVSSDEEETYTSAYGKKNFVLPVTFFDISRNVKQLNKCKPLSIRIVDCKQHPTYYTKEQEKCENKSDKSGVEVENKCNTNSETKSNNVNAEGIVNITHTTENVGEKSIKEGKKKRQSDSFYEKLKNSKEKRKRMALNCKDLSRVDFKRNTGLVGLKITDTIFRQIVDTENALINAKCSSVETKPKDKNQNYAEKPITSKNITSDNKCNKQHNSVVEKALDMEKFISNEKKCAEINEKYHSGSGKKLLYTKKTISSDDNSRGNMANAMENWPIKQSTYVENKSNDKNESDIQKAYIVPKSLDSDKNKTKEKSETIADKEIKTNTKSVVKCKEKNPENGEKALIRNRCNPKEEKSKDEVFECNKYMKKVGATLNNLGTCVIPLTNNHTPKSSHNNSETKSIKAGISQNTDKDVKVKLDNNKVSSEKRCSLKILSNNVNENALKLKKTKPENKTAANIVLQQNSKNPHAKVNEIATNVLLKRSNIECSVISDKAKEPTKSTSSKQEDSNVTKQVDKVVVKDASREQAGPNSPVIPCTTITIRAATSKSAPKETSAKVNNTTKKQISSTNQSDLTNSKRTPTLRPNEPAVSEANINKNSPLMCNQHTSNIKTLKITELKKRSNDSRASLSNLEYNVSVMNKRAFSDPNVPNINKTKGADMLNTTVKPSTPTGNTTFVANLSMNGMINNQANPNQKTNMPPTSQIPSKFSGHNAIILRRPPIPQPQHYPPPNQRQPIQTVVNNRFQYQPIPTGPRPTRFHYPPPFPPPPPPPTPPNNHQNFTQVRPAPQRLIMPNGLPSTYSRGMEMGLNQWRFYNPPLPPVYRPSLPVPRPPSPQLNKDSFIGNTADGDPIKKINIPVVTPIVDDKQKMLAELNNAMMSPELMKNQNDDPPKDLKRKADVPIDLVKPKHSKPGPLSKKTNITTDSSNVKIPDKLPPDTGYSNITTDSSNVKIPDKLPPNTGYSPPILPIFTYQESFKIFTIPLPNESKNSGMSAASDTKNRTPLKKTTSTASIRKLDKNHKRIPHHENGGQDKAKKITFEDYRKRVTKDDADKMDVNKVRKYNESKNAADDHNQDQGYDSDSTVKL